MIIRDCILLQATDGTTILVDAGPPVPGASPVVRQLRALRVPRLHAVLASHPHDDHVGGLPAVLENLPVGAVLHAVEGPGPEPWRRVRDAARRRRVPLVPVYAADRLRLGRSVLTILGPWPSLKEEGDPNERSVAARWEEGKASVLLTGDAPAAEELSLLRWGPLLRADVLKVAHHGSGDSTPAPWLAAAAPRAAVISCGRENRYGHPAPETLERLKSAGVPVYRTDRSGLVTLQLSPGRLRVECRVPDRGPASR